MRKFFTLSLLLISFWSTAQTICGTAGEGGSVTLTAPAGCFISSINFASYGTPNGSCGSFTIGGCHAANSITICQSAFVGQNSATLNATNTVFGDPCGGTVKRLYVQATYSAILPVRLISFTARKTSPGKVDINWATASEMNASEFMIEKSIDGSLFERAGVVMANGSSGASYRFSDNILNNIPTYYYRLKMSDRDGKFQYSNIIRIQNSDAVKLSIFPNPASDVIAITVNKKQQAVIVNAAGQVVQKISLLAGGQTINIERLAPGIYFIKTDEVVVKFFKTAF